MVLTPTRNPTAPKWVICRGTSPYIFLKPGANNSIKADISKEEGLDEEVINSGVSKTILDEVFARTDGERQKPIVCGHSLGGFMTTLITLEYHDCISRSYGFGATGVSEEVKTRYDQFKEEPELLKTFNRSGDFVPVANSNLIGDVYDVSHAGISGKDSSIITRHVDMFMNRNGFCIKRVNKEAEENNYGARQFANIIRKTAGKCWAFPEDQFTLRMKQLKKVIFRESQPDQDD
jgi:hypothetical protein